MQLSSRVLRDRTDHFSMFIISAKMVDFQDSFNAAVMVEPLPSVH